MKETAQLKKWKSNFGKEYTDRNTLTLQALEKIYQGNFGVTRLAMNKLFLRNLNRSSRILEVGANTSNQLMYLQRMGFKNLYGIEPQEYAVEFSKKRVTNINLIRADVFDIPFKDKYFDIVFTSGVLIHLNPKDISFALKEIYRCSRKYIWGFEYYAQKYTEVSYRENKNLLWKANFPQLYLDLFPNLKLEKIKFFKYLNSDNVDVMFLLKKKNAK